MRNVMSERSSKILGSGIGAADLPSRRSSGRLIGYGTLVVTLALFVFGYFTLPRPYHQRLGGQITGVIAAFLPGEGVEIVLANAGGIARTPYRFVAHIAGAVPVACDNNFVRREIALTGVTLLPAAGVPRGSDVYRISRLRDDAEIARLLVAEGCAYAASDELKTAEDSARLAGRGIWSGKQ